MEEVSITKEAIEDLSRLTNEINDRVESLELISLVNLDKSSIASLVIDTSSILFLI